MLNAHLVSTLVALVQQLQSGPLGVVHTVQSHTATGIHDEDDLPSNGHKQLSLQRAVHRESQLEGLQS